MGDEQDQYWTRATGPSTISGGKKLAAPTSPAVQARNRANWISQRARMVFGSYRRDDYADPDMFLAQLGTVLEKHTDAIVTEATDPVTGIQAHCKFPPSIAEFSDFCAELQRRSSYASEWEARSRQQLEERELFEREGKAESIERRTQVADTIREELRVYGFKFEGDRAYSPQRLAAELKKKYNINDDTWDKIPNLNWDDDAWRRAAQDYHKDRR